MTAVTLTGQPPLLPIEAQALASNPQWQPFSARPPTETEAARYADRVNNPEWAWLYTLAAAAPQPAVPEPGPALDPLPEPEPEPEPEPPAGAGEAPGLGDLDDRTEAALERFNQAHDAEPPDSDATTLIPAADAPAQAIEVQS